MGRDNRRRDRWDLTREALEELLGALHADRERAGERYSAIHARLVRYFERHGCVTPEEQADETINRVARRVEAGLELRTEQTHAYFLGVARKVLQEYYKAVAAAERAADLAHPFLHARPEAGDDERRIDCLGRCLEGLPAEARDLIERYYGSEAASSAEHRKRLAEKLGLTVNGMRIRACRARATLASCIARCLSGVGAPRAARRAAPGEERATGDTEKA
jgi:hypothetical protein